MGKSGHLSEIENISLERITCIPVNSQVRDHWPNVYVFCCLLVGLDLMWCLSVACSSCGCESSFFFEIIVEHKV